MYLNLSWDPLAYLPNSSTENGFCLAEDFDRAEYWKLLVAITQLE